MKKETQFSEPANNDGEKSKSKLKNVENKKAKRKTSLQLMRSKEAEWIKQNVCTKVKVNSEGDNEEDIIEEVETKAFGVIDFIGAARRAKAKFVQMSNDTHADIIFNLLTTQWKLAEPQILISITGGAKLFKMEEHLKEFFVEGLRKITQSPGTWVITGGTNTGIMKLVGESLQGVTKSLIGISTWGAITNTNSLYGNDKDVPLGGTFPYEVASSLTEYRTFLDHNHPYHLLVDDSSKGKYGKEIPLVSRLLKYVAHEKDRKAPAVMLLLEGGINSLENVINAVASETPIPVLVVNGSGRAADILSYAIQFRQEIDLSGDRIDTRLYKFIKENTSDSVEIIYSKVLTCLVHKDMISVVKVNKEEGIDVQILKAILDCYELTDEQRLQYTVLWNRVDAAENLFLDINIKWKKECLENGMVMALALNRYKFVEYFVEQNISIHKLMTKRLLEFLYGHRSTRPRSIVKYYVDRSPSPKHLDFFTLLKGNESPYIISFEDICNLLFSNKKLNLGDMDFTGQGYKVWYSKHPYRDIFLWAVVNNMQDMAKLLWKLGDEQIAKAIVAAEIYRKLAEKAEKESLSDEIIQMLKNNQIEFRELALKVLDSCYSENTSKTKVLLTSELVQFPSQNCIRIANESGFQEFIAHKAVQQVLKELWCGELRYEKNMIKIKDTRKEEDTAELKEEVDVADVGMSTDPKVQLIDGKSRSQNYSTYMSQDEQQQYNGSDNKTKYSTINLLQLPFNAPLRKFITSLVSYCIFLLLISYCAVLKKEDVTLNVIEIIVFVWVISYTIEEIYQVSVTPAPTIVNQLISYLKSFFNIVDIAAVFLYFIAFALQLNSSSMEYGHLLYAIDAMLWIVRLLQYFYANKILGPYVLMIGRMFIDMCYFISILFVFLLAYGVLSSAILRPEKRIYKMIKNIVYFPYFNIYGELFADNDSSPGMTKFGTKEINDYGEPISWFFLGIFLLISNVLLLNLLIAIFGSTFSEVQEKADQIWRFRRHDLVIEYALKLSLPPPFTVFICIWKMILSTRKKISSKNAARVGKTDKDILREEIEEFQMKHVINVLWLQKTELQKNDMNERWEEMHEVLKTLETQISNLQERK